MKSTGPIEQIVIYTYFIVSECSCGLQATVSQLQLQVNKLEIENDQLKKKIANMKNKRSILKLRNQKLEQSLVSKVLPEPARPFKDVEGFPTAEDIMNMSVRAEDSDYLFIKFLMYAIWPEGFKQRSVTGRISNNPEGRPKKRKAEEDHIDESSNLRECEEIEDAADDTEDGNIDTGSTSATPDTRCIALEAAKIDFVRGIMFDKTKCFRILIFVSFDSSSFIGKAPISPRRRRCCKESVRRLQATHADGDQQQ